MNEFDFDGEMDIYQNQLAEHGISKEQFDMSQFVGLTERELQQLVDGRIRLEKVRKEDING